MARRNRGFLLTEILVQLTVMSLILFLSLEPIRMLVHDFQQTNQDYQTQYTVRNMMDTLREDVRTAQRMTIVESDPRTGGSVLCLQRDSDILLYQLSDGVVSRRSLSANSGCDLDWSLPRLRIDWNPRYDSDGRIQSLEITTWIERMVLRKNRSFLRNSQIVFSDLDPVGGRL
jgi:type II secretory pathway pseudopilin PulG